jgi:hypothetical protein
MLHLAATKHICIEIANVGYFNADVLGTSKVKDVAGCAVRTQVDLY